MAETCPTRAGKHLKTKKINSLSKKAACILTLIFLLTATLYAYVLRQKSISDWSKKTENLSLILAEHSGQVMFSANTALDSILDSLKAEDIRTQEAYRDFASKKEHYQTLLEKIRANPLISIRGLHGAVSER